MKKAGVAVVLLLGILLVLGFACGGGGGVDVGSRIDTAHERAYTGDKDRIQISIGDYMVRNLGEIPFTDETITVAGVECDVVDICRLVMSYTGPEGPGLLLEVPESCADTVNDNCCEGSCSCYPNAHYIWAVTAVGDVKSSCVGGDCDASNEDGFQGVYP